MNIAHKTLKGIILVQIIVREGLLKQVTFHESARDQRKKINITDQTNITKMQQ